MLSTSSLFLFTLARLCRYRPVLDLETADTIPFCFQGGHHRDPPNPTAGAAALQYLSYRALSINVVMATAVANKSNQNDSSV